MKFPGLKTTFKLYFLCLNKLISQSHNLSFCHVQRKKTNKQLIVRQSSWRHWLIFHAWPSLMQLLNIFIFTYLIHPVPGATTVCCNNCISFNNENQEYICKTQEVFEDVVLAPLPYTLHWCKCPASQPDIGCHLWQQETAQCRSYSLLPSSSAHRASHHLGYTAWTKTKHVITSLPKVQFHTGNRQRDLAPDRTLTTQRPANTDAIPGLAASSGIFS